jgi:ubiquinone/menaquinone biosynthesis C-methylase UbiE
MSAGINRPEGHRVRRFRPVALLLGAISRVAPGLQARAQKALIKKGYEFVNRCLNRSADGYMNYGYAPLDPPLQDLQAGLQYEADRFGIQLYSRVAGAVDLSGKNVLEVGCGRGDGAAYLFRHLGAGSVTGVDLAERAIVRCRREHRGAGLRFISADAEDLPFAPESFDAVINVESSHCYSQFERFLSEVKRVLRDRGLLLFADLRPRDGVLQLREQFAASGFLTLEEERITSNVVRALELDTSRRLELIREVVPRPLQRLACDFAAVEGSKTYESLRSGELEYLRFVLQRRGVIGGRQGGSDGRGRGHPAAPLPA